MKTYNDVMHETFQTTGDVMAYLTERAKEWIPDSMKSIQRNYHMNNCPDDLEITKANQNLVDAAIIDYLNYIASCYCMNYDLHANDLRYERKSLGTYNFGDDPWIR